MRVLSHCRRSLKSHQENADHSPTAISQTKPARRASLPDDDAGIGWSVPGEYMYQPPAGVPPINRFKPAATTASASPAPTQMTTRRGMFISWSVSDAGTNAGLAPQLQVIGVTCNVTGMARHRSAVSVGDRVREHRLRLRAQGLRPIQIWVPDVRSPEFAAQAHQQSMDVANSVRAADDQAFVDAVSLDEE